MSLTFSVFIRNLGLRINCSQYKIFYFIFFKSRNKLNMKRRTTKMKYQYWQKIPVRANTDIFLMNYFYPLILHYIRKDLLDFIHILRQKIFSLDLHIKTTEECFVSLNISAVLVTRIVIGNVFVKKKSVKVFPIYKCFIILFSYQIKILLHYPSNMANEPRSYYS